MQNNPPRLKSRSLAVRLLRVVFSIYLCITVIITGVQMFNEYMFEKEGIRTNLKAYEGIFYDGVGTALWNLDVEQVIAMMEGVDQLHDVVGVKVHDSDDEEIVAIGTMDSQSETKAPGGLATMGLFFHRFPVDYKGEFVGTVYFYSSDAVVLERVKYNFLAIIVNAIIKTVILWLLFIWAFKRYLVRALDSFMSRMEQMDVDQPLHSEPSLDTLDCDELKRFEAVFNAMSERIQTSRRSLKSLNEELELKVIKRTHQLSAQQQMLEQMSQQGRIGAWEVDLVENKVYWSPMTREIHQVDEDYQPSLECMVSFFDGSENRDTLLNSFDACIKHQQPWHHEFLLVSAKGNPTWVRSTGQGQYENGTCVRVFGAYQDIDDQVKARMEVLKAKDAAESAVRMKSDFLATMSHEIRTPMNGVLGMLGLLLKTPLSEQQTHYAELAATSGKSLLGLINDILDFSKVDAGKLELEKEPFNLTSLITDTVQTLTVKGQEKGLEMILTLHRLQNIEVIGDSGRVGQVLTNLLGNAIKFTEHGHVQVSAAFEEESAQRGRLVCTVKDTGIGIPSEKQAHIFDLFTQVDASTTRQYGGTGLGLAISRQLCRLMGGDVSLKSTVGDGSEFTFWIPFNLVSSSSYISKRAFSTSHEYFQAIVVEENAVTRASLCDQLAVWGMKALATTSLDQVRSVVTTWPTRDVNSISFTVLVSEELVDTKKMDTINSELKSRGMGNVRFICLTPLGVTLEAKEGWKEYFERSLSKPVSPDALSKVLQIASDSDRNTQEVVHQIHDEWPDSTRVLLVEDNDINQLVAQGILEKIGLSCDVASNGVDAIRQLQLSDKANPFALILMDCQMPEMDGYEATSSIRSGGAGERYLNTPIIAMTANAMKGDKERCLAAGMNDYLSKPIDAEALKLMLQRWLIEVEYKGGVDC
jgi:signal transduction histidine kinase/CheY-like chemotaxis protein